MPEGILPVGSQTPDHLHGGKEFPLLFSSEKTGSDNSLKSKDIQ